MLLWSAVGGQLLPSAVIIMLLWSGVGGQLLSSCCCGLGLVVSYYHHVAVVRSWWSTVHTLCFRRNLLQHFRGKKSSLLTRREGSKKKALVGRVGPAISSGEEGIIVGLGNLQV